MNGIIGIDIGGANLKAVRLLNGPLSCHQTEKQIYAPQSQAVEIPFAMWEQWQSLPLAIEQIFERLDSNTLADRIAVTMTGELADCFACKKEGVEFIAQAMLQAAGDRSVAFYLTDGSWYRPPISTKYPDGRQTFEASWPLMAASNWHAMARLGSRLLSQQTGLMVDVGSTTTDVIPIRSGEPCGVGDNDFDRLANLELIYAGVGRTPIISLIQSVDLPSGPISLARELFATIDDALVWTHGPADEPSAAGAGGDSGLTLERSIDAWTADRRPRTFTAAGQRLARMVCSDLSDVDDRVIDAIAKSAIGRLEELLCEAVSRQRTHFSNIEDTGRLDVLLVGQGVPIAQRLLHRKFPNLRFISFADRVGQTCSDCGPAYAVADLLRDDERGSATV